MAASDHYSAIQKLYIAYFNRPADVLGLQYWSGVVEANGGHVAAIANEFSGSQEYKTEYGGKSSVEVVRTIYQNLFGREPEPAGLAYWSIRLDNGTFNIGNIVYSVMQGALGSDATILENKLAAAIAFTTNLDTVAEISAYSGDSAAALGRKFLSGITADAPSTSALDGAIGKAIGELLGTTEEKDTDTGTDTGPSTPTPVFSASLDSVTSTVTFTNPGGAISLAVDMSYPMKFTFTSSGSVVGTSSVTVPASVDEIEVPTGTVLSVKADNFGSIVTYSGGGGVKIVDPADVQIASTLLASFDDQVVDGLLDATNYVQVEGSVAEVLRILVTDQGTTIKTAANIAVELKGAIAAADDLNKIDAATTGLVSSSTITTLTGTAADVQTVLTASAAATALSLSAVTTVTLAGAAGSLTLANSAVGDGETMTVNASALMSGNGLTFDGSAETNGTFVVTGGAGDDTITGGAGNDTITGGAGADTLTGGGGADTFVYTSAADGGDTITEFVTGEDKISLQGFGFFGINSSTPIDIVPGPYGGGDDLGNGMRVVIYDNTSNGGKISIIFDEGGDSSDGFTVLVADLVGTIWTSDIVIT